MSIYKNINKDIQQSYNALVSYMKTRVTLDILFDTESYQKDRFDKVYLHFVKSVSSMEDIVHSYLKVWNSLFMSSL